MGGQRELFDYQEELKDKAVRCLTSEVGARRAVIGMPTGGGKTRTAAVVIRELVESRGVGVIYWIAPSLELLWQATEAVEAAWARRDVEKLHLRSLGPDGPTAVDAARPVIIFLTAQWLASRGQLRLPESMPAAGLIVFDEAHHAAAPSYLEGIETLSNHKHEGRGAPLLGLSATPGRMNVGGTSLLADLFGRRLLVSEALGRDPVLALQERGVLSSITFELLGTEDPSVARITNWNARPRLRELSHDPSRFKAAVMHVRDTAPQGRMLVFANSIRHATALAAGIIASGVRTAAVTNATPDGERQRFVRWFRDGLINVLINKELFTTGFDLPAIDAVLLTAPIFSPIRFEQIVGRAIRGPAVGGSPTAKVFQFERHEDLHGSLESYSRFWDADWRPE